jgi:hypothetical protein
MVDYMRRLVPLVLLAALVAPVLPMAAAGAGGDEPVVTAYLGCGGRKQIVVDADEPMVNVTVTGTRGDAVDTGPPVRRWRVSTRGLGRIVAVDVELEDGTDISGIEPVEPTDDQCAYRTVVRLIPIRADGDTGQCDVLNITDNEVTHPKVCQRSRSRFTHDFAPANGGRYEYISLYGADDNLDQIEVNEHNGGSGLYLIQYGVNAADGEVFNTSGGTRATVGRWFAWDTPSGNRFRMCISVKAVDLAQRVPAPRRQCRR